MIDYSVNGSIIAVEGISPLEHKALDIRSIVAGFMSDYYLSFYSKYDNGTGTRTYSFLNAEDNSLFQPYIEIFDDPTELRDCFNSELMRKAVGKQKGISDKSSLILDITSDLLIKVDKYIINFDKIMFENHTM